MVKTNFDTQTISVEPNISAAGFHWYEESGENVTKLIESTFTRPEHWKLQVTILQSDPQIGELEKLNFGFVEKRGKLAYFSNFPIVSCC